MRHRVLLTETYSDGYLHLTRAILKPYRSPSIKPLAPPPFHPVKARRETKTTSRSGRSLAPGLDQIHFSMGVPQLQSRILG